MATANQDFAGYGRRSPLPKRLTGALAAGTVIGLGETAKERVLVEGLSKLRARVDPSSITGTLTVNLHPMLSDATADDTVGTRAGAGAPTAVTSTGSEAVITIELAGERYVEVELSMSSGLGDTCTLAYVEIFGTPL